MAEKLVGLTIPAFQSTARVVKHVTRTIVARPHIKRRQYPSGSGGAPRIKFTILSASFSIGYGALGCDSVTGLVNHVSCDGTGVSHGDEVLIYDPDYCYFNLPIELLVGLSGTATMMSSDNYQPGLDYVLDCLYEIRAEGCIWMIDTLCCSEEEFI